MLQQVARRLLTCVREGDTVARLGGDEFVVMLEDLSENALEAATQAETVGEKILVALNQPYQLGRLRASQHAPASASPCSASISESIDDLLKRADLAMYQAKAAGRNTLRFFDPEMQAVGHRPCRAGGRLARGACEKAVPAVLPGPGGRRRPHHRGRSAGALAASAARHGVAGRVHSAGRGNRLDPAVGPMGAGDRLRPIGAVGAPSRTWRI